MEKGEHTEYSSPFPGYGVHIVKRMNIQHWQRSALPTKSPRSDNILPCIKLSYPDCLSGKIGRVSGAETRLSLVTSIPISSHFRIREIRGHFASRCHKAEVSRLAWTRLGETSIHILTFSAKSDRHPKFDVFEVPLPPDGIQSLPIDQPMITIDACRSYIST